MSKKHSRAEQLACLYSELPAEEQRQALALILSKDAPEPRRWTTLGQAAAILQVSTSQASRYAADGKLLANGKTKKALRIAISSILAFLVERMREQRALLTWTAKRRPNAAARSIDLAERARRAGLDPAKYTGQTAPKSESPADLRRKAVAKIDAAMRHIRFGLHQIANPDSDAAPKPPRLSPGELRQKALARIKRALRRIASAVAWVDDSDRFHPGEPSRQPLPRSAAPRKKAAARIDAARGKMTSALGETEDYEYEEVKFWLVAAPQEPDQCEKLLTWLDKAPSLRNRVAEDRERVRLGLV